MRGTFDIELDKGDETSFNNYFIRKEENSIQFLPTVNNINVFIGANNSGKSRFLRELMNISELIGISDKLLLNSLIDKYNSLAIKFNDVIQVTNTPILYLTKTFGKDLIEKDLKFQQNDKFKINEIDVNSSLNNLIIDIREKLTIKKKLELVFLQSEKLFGSSKEQYIRGIYFGNNQLSDNLFYLKKIDFRKINEIILDIEKSINTILNLSGKKIYIPTLRTAHSLFEVDNESELNNTATDAVSRKKIRRDIFLETIKKNYSFLNKNVDIFTGLNLYNEIVNVRNSIKEERFKFHDFEDFLSVNFFESKDVDIVAKFNIDNNDNGLDDDKFIQVHIDGKSRKLYDLGDGVQSLIILMYKIFLAEKDSIIFIDEPELNLHPGYQRLFLEQITTNPKLLEKNLTYFIVTHSNHFLDLTLEKDNVSIYSFNSFEKDKFLIKNVNAGDNQVLRDLGVNNSSVFLANSSIWVEGISDRNFIKAFLKAYCLEKGKPEPREDIDFAFFEYAGSNLTHYNFKKGTNNYKEAKDLITSYALNNKIFLLSDLDSGKDAKHKNIKEIAKETEGFEYFTTAPYRELENLLCNSVWKKVLLNFCNKKDIKENEENVLKRINESLKKNNSEDYKKEYIGEFLKDLKITELNKVFTINEDKTAGTFIPKAELSQLILTKVRNEEITWSDFSKNQTIANLTEAVYNFILKSKF